MTHTSPGLFLNTADLEGRIAGRYPSPAWTTLFEVRDGTGFQTRGQEADAMAFGTWPSRGLNIVGFEIKTYRSDWLRELKNPAKAEGIANFCDQWWLVSGEGVVREEEVPPAWGWYLGTEKGLKVMKPAQVLQPQPISRIFLMSVMRNMGKNYVRASQVKKLAQKKADDIVEQKQKENEYKLEEAAKFEKLIEDFHSASGIDLTKTWSFPVKEVGAVVKAITERDFIRQAQVVKKVAEDAGQLLDAIMALPIIKSLDEAEGK